MVSALNVDLGEVDYVGGNPAAPTRDPMPGYLHVTNDGFRFDVMGEYREVLWLVPWDDVVAWDAGGPIDQSRGSAAGRIVVGALVLGVAGALLASATSRRQYQTVLAVQLAESELVFLISTISPPSLISQLQVVPEARSRRRPAGSQPVEAVPRSSAWGYQTATLDEIDALGLQGWEAIGLWQDPERGVRVLCKRPL